MTQKFRYTGPGPVDLPEFALVDVNPGTLVEVDDPERAESMHSSPDWTHVPDKARSQAAKKAARKRTSTPPKKAASRKAAASKPVESPASEVKSPEANPESDAPALAENRDPEQEN